MAGALPCRQMALSGMGPGAPVGTRRPACVSFFCHFYGTQRQAAATEARPGGRAHPIRGRAHPIRGREGWVGPRPIPGPAPDVVTELI